MTDSKRIAMVLAAALTGSVARGICHMPPDFARHCQVGTVKQAFASEAEVGRPVATVDGGGSVCEAELRLTHQYRKRRKEARRQPATVKVQMKGFEKCPKVGSSVTGRLRIGCRDIEPVPDSFTRVEPKECLR